MKKAFFLFLIIAITSCKNQEKKELEKPIFASENDEMIAIYLKDQSDYNSHDANWAEISKRDSLRRIQVTKIIEANELKTAKDYRNAAMIFIHGKDSTDFKKAISLMKKAIEIDSTINKWPFAAATDTYLLSIGKPQIYGTQYYKMNNEQWKIAYIDTTKISDKERIAYGVETLKQQIQKVIQMNSKSHAYDDGHGH